MDKLNKYCRLCLSESVPMVPIFGSEHNIPLQLSTCLSIEISTEDLLPKTICLKCSKILHQYYDFFIHSKYCEQWLLACLNEPSQLLANEAPKPVQCKDNMDKQQSPYGSDFLPEFLDMEFLNSDSNTLPALECLTSESNAVSQLPNDLTVTKITNYKGNASSTNNSYDYYEIHMDIDVLDSDLDIVNEILAKQSKTSKLKPLCPSEECSNYSCLSCKAAFQDFEELAHHMGGCDALKRTCTCCGKLFESRESLNKHKNIHSELSVVTCEHCNKQFVGQGRLSQHIEQTHSDFVTESGFIYRCKQCGNIFQSKDKMYNHAKMHVKTNANEKKKKYFCNECSVTFSSQKAFADHRTLKHDKKTNSCLYRCKVCLKIFSDRDILYKHVKQHTNVLERTQHLCDTCGQSFNSYNILSKHVLTHVGNQFQCIICLKSFINGSLLKKHLATHEIETQICELCGLIFSNDILLNMHQNDAHSGLF